VKRKIVGISGQFALADDGSCWMWTDTGWKPWGRGSLPDSEGLDFYQTTSSPPWPTTQGVPEAPAPSTTIHADNTVTVAPVKRGPGRPRKVQP